MKNVAPPTSPGRRKSLLTRSAPGGGGGRGAAEMLPYNTHTRFLHLLGRSASWEGLRVVSQRTQRLLLGSNCAPTPFAGPNSSAALICVSGWKRDLSLPKQRGSKDPRRGPIRHHYCLFRLFRRGFFVLTLSQCWRCPSQGESSLIKARTVPITPRSVFSSLFFSQQLSPPRPSITGAFGSQIFLFLLFAMFLVSPPNLLSR